MDLGFTISQVIGGEEKDILNISIGMKGFILKEGGFVGEIELELYDGEPHQIGVSTDTLFEDESFHYPGF